MLSGWRATLRRRYSNPSGVKPNSSRWSPTFHSQTIRPSGGHLVDSLVPDDVWAERRNFSRDRHQNEPVAVLEQFPVVVLAGGTAGRLGAPLPELLPRPRQLADGAVAVDAAGRFVQLGQLNADIADASGIESGVADPGRNTGIRPLFAYHTFEVDQPGDAVGARIENVTVVRELGVVVGHAAELNESHGE